MPARPRRTRVLVGVLAFVFIVIFYTRTAPIADYSGYVADKIGGGSVLREGAGKDDTPQPPQDEPVLGKSIVPSRTEEFPEIKFPEITEPAVQSTSTSSSALAVETTSSALPRPPAPEIKPVPVEKPYFEPDPEEKLPYELGEGGKELGETRTKTKPVYWHPRTEHNPVSSTIQLPTQAPSPLPRIQYKGKLPADTVRLDAVRRAASHAWGGYRDAAFGHDEVKPVSGGKKNPFNGWGATLVDSLDTLWIMGLKHDFEEAVAAVAKVEFTTSPRYDIPLFETTIRYLGGLLGAYDVSEHKYKVLLDKAVELAEVLYGAFDTPNRMPVTYYQWRPEYANNSHRASSRVVMAELGTLSLEFTRLAQLTKEPKYYDAIARITDALEVWQNNTRLPGMWPISVDASGCGTPIYKPPKPKYLFDETSTSKTSTIVADQSGKKPAPPNGHWQNGMRPPLKDDDVPGGTTASHTTAGDSSGPQGKAEPGPLGLEDAKHAAAERVYGKTLDKRFDVSMPDSDIVVVNDNDEDDDEEDLCPPQGLASPSKYGAETFTLGGQSDSTYEYLPKEWLLLGGTVDQYRTMYIDHAKTAIKHLMFRPMTKVGYDLLVSGNVLVSLNQSDKTESTFIAKHEPHGEHLTCFVGGMFAMGGKLFNRPEDVEVARKLTEGCIWSYNSTATGIMPEGFNLMPCEDRNHCPYNKTAYWQALDPYEASRTYVAPPPKPKASRPRPAPKIPSVPSSGNISVLETGTAEITQTALYQPYNPGGGLGKRQLAGTVEETEKEKLEEFPTLATPTLTQQESHNNGLDSPVHPIPPKVVLPVPEEEEASEPEYKPYVYTPPPPLSHKEYVTKKIKDDRLPDGFTEIGAKGYILRPEAIESVFYMYRITGEQHWRDAGWQMFQSVARHCRAAYGHSAIDDVTKAAPEQRDSMESFWLAETLKYFYLLFDDGAKWSLDDWVLNTEAHFFKRPEGGFLDEKE